MKVFISQKMWDRTHDEIIYERDVIFSKWVEFRVAQYDQKIDSYLSEFKLKDPIKCLANSLSLMADADVVLVSWTSIVRTDDMCYGVPPGQEEIDFWDSNNISESFYASQDTKLDLEFVKENIRGCELELLVALAYGKKVYYYDDNYKFTEVK